jgi:pimeloyl-ACP methyl ester carboxylesterase
VRVDFFETPDRARIAVHRAGPEGGGLAVLVPGAFSNHEFWLGTRGTGFGRELANRRWECWAVDPRGHGQSSLPAGEERWAFRDWIRYDLPAVLEAASRDGRRVVLIGHSAGGAAALSTLAVYPDLARRISGLGLIATPAPILNPFRRLGAWTIAALSVVFGRFPARLLRHGSEDELRHVMTEWMGWNLRGSWGWDDEPDLLARLRHVELPILVVAGSGDHLFAPPAVCRALFDMLPGRDKTFFEFGRATGYSKDYDHAGLIVDRSAREEVWPRIIEWMDRVPSRQGS